MSRRVPRRLDCRDAWCNRGVSINWPQARVIGVHAKPLSDVILHERILEFDEVLPVPRTEPDGRVTKDRPGLPIEQPSDVIGVQVGADDIGDIVCPDPQGPQADRQLTADQAAGVAIVIGRLGRPHTGVDQDASSSTADEETADGKPCLAVEVEQIIVTISGGVVTEIAWASDERTVRYGADDYLANLHEALSHRSSL